MTPSLAETPISAARNSGSHFRVTVSGHKATLTGTVDSWYQKDEAGRIAGNAPGVWNVGNDLVVEYAYD